MCLDCLLLFADLFGLLSIVDCSVVCLDLCG